MNTWIRMMSLVLCAAVPVFSASAQSWPNKPIRLILLGAAGGSVDTLASVMQTRLQTGLGQPIGIENKAGAVVAKSPPDGYTLLIGAHSTHVINPALMPNTIPFILETRMSSLSSAVRAHRLARLQHVMDAARLDALALSSVEWFEFATNHNITVGGWERPYVVVVTRDGRSCALMHDLSSVRASHALRIGRMWLDDAHFYAEVPHVTHRRPMLPLWAETLAQMLQHLGLAAARVGVDAQPAPMQRLGQLLPELKLLPAGRWLRDARLVKHAEEIALLRAAASLSDWAIERYRAEIRPGRNLQEMDHTVAGQTCVEAGRRFPGEDFQILRFMSLSGPASAAAHGDGCQSGATVLRDAATVTICNVRLNGMSMENQKTFAVGRVDDTTRRLMQVALQANEAGLAAARTGAPLTGIDEASLQVICAAGHGAHVLHRTGHGIGVGTHEYPEDMAFDTRPLLEHEALIVEPGIYVPGLGGFRYVDGVIVGAEPECLTHAPKDFTSMCIA